MDNPRLNIMSLCSGGGGLDLGLDLALGNARVVCGVEWEAFACEVLASRMDAKLMAPFPVWSNLRTFDGKPWCGVVDILSAGYPCQPFSLAGKRRGSDDPRHLWPHVHRVVSEVKPPVCFFENVSGHLSLGFDEVTCDLEALGYKVAAGLFTAEEVGALHQRDRLFILGVQSSSRADTLSVRLQGERPSAEKPWAWKQLEGLVQTDLRLCVPAGESGGVANGLDNHRSNRLKMLGNGVVPLQGAYAFCSLWAALRFKA